MLAGGGQPALALAVLAGWALACAAVAPTGPSSRTRYLLDDGWKFCGGSGGPGASCGLPPPAPPPPPPPPPPACRGSPNASFPTDLGAFGKCGGLVGGGVVPSPGACAQQCCAQAGCRVWNWCSESGCADGKPGACWVDPGHVDPSSCHDPRAPGWVARSRSRAPQPAPPPRPPPPTPLPPCSDPRCLPGTDDSGWRQLDRPHDFVVEGTFSANASKSQGYLPFGVGWYRKRFTVPADAAGGAVWLDFDGTQAHSTVWLDGQQLGGHASGYTPYRFHLDASRLAGRAVLLAARVDATLPDSWWYDGGGIYRSVWLTVASSVHVEPWGVYAPALVAGPIAGGHAPAELVPSVEVTNGGPATAHVAVDLAVLDARGVAVAGGAASVTVAAGGTGLVNYTQSIAIGNASLWSLQSPYLYTLRTTLSVAGQQADVVDTRFGVRKTVFDPHRGFLLNDVPTKIFGCANHQDFAGVGVAVPDSLQLHRVAKLKEMGANAWRTAHNCPNEGLLEAADTLGFLVWDENHRSTQPEEAAILVRRDRNHPSVIIWSICNEVLCSSHSNNGSAVKAVFKELDPLMQRPTSANLDAGQTFPPPVWYKDTMDLVGFDYGTAKYDAWLALVGAGKLAISSETSSAQSDRGEYSYGDRGYIPAYHTRDHGTGYGNDEYAWEGIMSRPRVAGGFTWTGWEYKGEDGGWPSVTSHFGILDEAGFPKDRWYWYQQLYLQPDPPLVHLLPHWNWDDNSSSGCHGGDPGGCAHLAECAGRCMRLDSSGGSGNSSSSRDGGGGGAVVDVWAYTNADEVELFVNGRSQGRRVAGSRSHAAWPGVAWEAGTIEARAYRNGSSGVLASKSVSTTGPASGLRVSIKDGVGLHGIVADNSDVALVQVEVVDGAGRVVPTANHSVTFSVAGPGKLIGTGNGDPHCHVSDKSPVLPAFHGLALGIVQGTLHAGDIKVSVAAAGLPGVHSITVPSRIPATRKPRL